MKQLLTIFILLETSIVFPQVNFDIQSPQTYDFVKYGNIPINHYLGEANVQIPIYEYNDPDFTIPISLRYSQEGCQPNKREGIAGLGWHLNAGGVITRKVNGFPDERQADLGEEQEAGHSDAHGTYYGFKNRNIRSKDKSDLLAKGTFDENKVWNIDKSEVQPDKFTFNFHGHNGSFYIQHDGSIVIEGNKHYKVDVSGLEVEPRNVIHGATNHLQVNSEIIITTDDGYTYEFGGSMQSLEVSYSVGYADRKVKGGSTVIAWHLTEVTAPNGRKITYKYKEFAAGFVRNEIPIDKHHFLLNIYGVKSNSSFEGNSLCNDSGTNTAYPCYMNNSTTYTGYAVSATKTVYLSTIEVDNSPVFNFSYEQRSSLFYNDIFTDNKGLHWNQYNYLLRSIVITNKTQEIKEFTLGYFTNTPRIYLKSFSETGLPSYQFDYYNKSDMPTPTTFGIDHWGFYNGKHENQIDDLLPSYTGADADIQYASNERNPTTDESILTIGMLKKVAYPTGGYTEFEYEAHDYSQRLERRAANNFLPYLRNQNGYVGGARVKRVTDHKSDNSIVKDRLIKYTSSYPSISSSSGILLQWPRYAYEFTQWVDTENLGRQGGTYHIAQSISYHLNRNPSEKYIHYGEVTEVLEPDGGYVKYEFTNYDSHPNKNDIHLSEENFDGITYESETDKNLMSNYTGLKFSNKSFERGFPKQIEYYTSGNLPVKRTMIDSFYGEKDYPNLYGIGILESGQYAQSYKIFNYPFKPKSQRELTYNSNGQTLVTTTTDFVYNEFGQLKEETNFLSSGVKKTKYYKYPNEYIDISPKYEDHSLSFITSSTSGSTNNSFTIDHTQSVKIDVNHFEMEDANGNWPVAFTIKMWFEDKNGNRHNTQHYRMPESSRRVVFSPGHYTIRFAKNNVGRDFYYYLNADINYQTKPEVHKDQFIDNNALGLYGLVIKNQVREPIEILESKDKLFTNGRITLHDVLNSGDELSNWIIKPTSVNQLLTESSINEGLGNIQSKTQKQGSGYNITYSFDFDNRYSEETLYKSDAENGRLIEYQIRKGIPISLIWGYDAKYPIAKIENATFSEVARALGVSTAALEKFNESNLSQINALRAKKPEWMITTYTHIPLVGVETITDPKGLTTTYEYDDFNRLKHIKDHNGDILEAYDYNYRTK